MKIETLFSFMYTYYNQFLKRHLECTKLLEVIESTKYELFCYVETMMGLTCVLPMLEAMQS
jgi:hypothetical protein